MSLFSYCKTGSAEIQQCAMEIEIKKLDHNDLPNFIDLIDVFEDVFEMKNFSLPNKDHLAGLLSLPDFIVFVACDDSKVIAGMTAYVMHQYYSERPLAYIFDLAVIQKHQRKGIGQQLISSFNQYCREKGFEEVFVQADQVDKYALDFYRSTKPTEEEEVSHFYYTL